MTSAGPALPPKPPTFTPDEPFERGPKGEKIADYSTAKRTPKRPDSSEYEGAALPPTESRSFAVSAAASSSQRAGWITLEASEAAGEIYARALDQKDKDFDAHERLIEKYADSLAQHNFPDNRFCQHLARDWVLHVELNHPFCSWNRENLAYAMGNKIFPESYKLAGIYARRILGRSSPSENAELTEAFESIGNKD